MERMWPLEPDIPGFDNLPLFYKVFWGVNTIIHAELLTQSIEQCRC